MIQIFCRDWCYPFQSGMMNVATSEGISVCGGSVLKKLPYPLYLRKAPRQGSIVESKKCEPSRCMSEMYKKSGGTYTFTLRIRCVPDQDTDLIIGYFYSPMLQYLPRSSSRHFSLHNSVRFSHRILAGHRQGSCYAITG